MNCPNCGAALGSGDRFCKFCSTALPAPPPPPPQQPQQQPNVFNMPPQSVFNTPQQPQQSAFDGPPPQQDPYAMPPDYQPPSFDTPPPRQFSGSPRGQYPPKKSGGKGCLIAIGVAALLVFLLIIALVTGFCSLIKAVDVEPSQVTQLTQQAEQMLDDISDQIENAIERPDNAVARPENGSGHPLAQQIPGYGQVEYAVDYLGWTVKEAREALGDNYALVYWNGSDSLHYDELDLFLFYGHTGEPEDGDIISSVMCADDDLPAIKGVYCDMTLPQLEAALNTTLTLEDSDEDGVDTAFYQGEGYVLYLFPDMGEMTWELEYYLVKSE